MREDQNTELKESFKDEYLKVISAFANSGGGKLIIGVNDNGQPVGVDNAMKLLEDIPNKIKNYLQITPFVSVEKRENKEILVIEVAASPYPVFYHGKLYIRSGSTTQELAGLELASFLIEKSGKTWDLLPCACSLEEIDEHSIETFIRLAQIRLPLISSIRNTNELFEKLKLFTNNGQLTRAAVLLFVKDPQKFFPTAYVKVGRFKTPTDMLDTILVHGNLFQQLEGTIEAVKKHLNVRFDTTVPNPSLEGLSRRDVWDYPIDAVREAVINALIHRDYLGTAPIQIKIFDDRMHIWNPGKLIPPLTLETLKQPHSGFQRNPTLALIFYYAGFIEGWGSGIDKMIQLCKTQNLPEPDFGERKEGLGEFSITFYKDIYTEENLHKLGLNERQIKAVLYVKEKGKITNREYRKLTGLSDEGVRQDIHALIEKNIFIAKGSGRNVHYVIRQTGN